MMKKDVCTTSLKRLSTFALALVMVFSMAAFSTTSASAANTSSTYFTIASKSYPRWVSVSTRSKTNTSSVYVKFDSVTGGRSLGIQIWGGYGSQAVANCTSVGTRYAFPYKENLVYNNVRERGFSAACLKVYVPANTTVRGHWSPDSVRLKGHVYYAW